MIDSRDVSDKEMKSLDVLIDRFGKDVGLAIHEYARWFLIFERKYGRKVTASNEYVYR